MHLYEDLGGKLELFFKGMTRPLQITLLSRMYVCPTWQLARRTPIAPQST